MFLRYMQSKGIIIFFKKEKRIMIEELLFKIGNFVRTDLPISGKTVTML